MNFPSDDSDSGTSKSRMGHARRDFLKLAALAAAGFATAEWPAMADPNALQNLKKLVPADKRLSPEWIKSLTGRGQRTIYRGADLEKIGMPVGGICAGHLYLGGDGTLWHWDIFNQYIHTVEDHYANPMTPSSPLDQGFALRINLNGQMMERALNREHWRDISFIGEYPMGFVDYRDADLPVSVTLKAFSPFIPLNTDDSSIPATVMQFTVKNESQIEVEAELAGWLENAVCRYSSETRDGLRRNRIRLRNGALRLECSAEDLPKTYAVARPDIVFDDFESNTYDNWLVSGTAFGKGPVRVADMPVYQEPGEVGQHGERMVNSHASAPGNDATEKDAAAGSMISRVFTIQRNYVTLLICGGNYAGKTCVNLVVENQVVFSATGDDTNRLRPVNWDVRPWTGKIACIQIVDAQAGDWGNIGVDDIVFSDHPRQAAVDLQNEDDFGTLSLAMLEAQSDDFANADLLNDGVPAGVFSTNLVANKSAIKPFTQKLLGSLARKLKLAPGASTTVTFVLAWHMPNLKMSKLPPGRFYATRFASAPDAISYVSREFPRLSRQTQLWHATWYDSTLPYWFLDRTFLNTSTLATSTCYRFGNGRFYGWEGVGSCWGTCNHVWQYAQAVARIFPELERITRENVDFGLAMDPDGLIHNRGEFGPEPAIDGQAGTILRALREHQMSKNDAFLRRTWPHIRKATEWLIAKDGNADGIIECAQPNTLDMAWYGAISWLSGLYLASLLAAETMATEVGDTEFAARCRSIFAAGQKNIVDRLYKDEYFVNKPDPKHLDTINSGTGCEIDQVFGQSWAFQVGLPRVFPRDKTFSALKSLWLYNFCPDVGPYREVYRSGRWLAMPGEAGLLMCTFPRTDWDYLQSKGDGPDWAAGYFNECMNGFEYEVAGHMIWEELITEGLAVTRAVHDRYHASRRNPWNEVECGDHYARSMASYGVFLAACGFEYNGPKGHIGFAPRLTPEDFRGPFTSAEGWGTYRQKMDGGRMEAEITVKWGQLCLNSVALESDPVQATGPVKVIFNNRELSTSVTHSDRKVMLTFERVIILDTETPLRVIFG
jgi:non-lysosomal glucosylceramidase